MKIFKYVFLFLILLVLISKETKSNDALKLKETDCSYVHPRIKVENDFWYNDENFLKNRKACYDLGLAYYNGIEVDVDKNKATEYFAKAMEFEDYDAQYMYGLMMLEGEGLLKKDLTKALDVIKKAGEKNSVLAQHKLASIYSEDKLVPKSDEDAFYWYLKAAQNGHNQSKYEVANRYELGVGVQEDMKQAVKWFGDSAQAGVPEAQYRLGMLFFAGDILPQDYKMAFNLMNAAAKQEFLLAKYFLGYMYEEGLGVPKDEKMAIKWYEDAANKGFQRAYLRLAELGITDYQIMLAKAYLLGESDFQKDATKSAYWLETAAKKGNADAQFKIGHYYFEGFGVEKSEEKAIFWLKAASLQGHKEASDFLEDILIKKDNRQFFAENKELFEMAERDGDVAQYQLAAKYEEQYKQKNIEDLEDRHLRQAVRWYQKSADLGNVEALFRLGNGYLRGDIVASDEKKAVEYLKKAGDKEHYEAQKLLARFFESRIGLNISNPYEYNILEDDAYWESRQWYERATALNKPEDFFRLGNFFYKHTPEKKKGYEESLYNAWYWLEKAKQAGVQNALAPIKDISRKVGFNFRIKENKMIETFVEKLINESQSDLYTAEKLGLRRYGREEMFLSDLFYGYAVNLKCGYDKSVTVGRGFALYLNEVNNISKKLKRQEKIEEIKKEAEEIAKDVVCDTREAYFSKRTMLKFADIN